MSELSVASVEKKFNSVTATQDSIQSLSLWVLHHKAQHEKIVEIWFNVLKKAKIEQRLVLFYLCNDIVQTCKKRHAVVYKDAFKDILCDAVILVRESSVRSKIERILNIWEERNVYDSNFVEEVQSILANTKVRPTSNSKLLADFKPENLIDEISRQSSTQIKIDAGIKSISKLDTSSADAIAQLKDLTHGKEFCIEFEEACTHLESMISSIQDNIKVKKSLIENLEQSELYYDAQYGEARVVTNAYKTFANRVQNLKRKLSDINDKFRVPSPVPSPIEATAPSPVETFNSDAPSPSPSPPEMDAPSPISTPPKDEPPIKIAGVNTDSVDMDLSDEENPSKKERLPVTASFISSNTLPGIDTSSSSSLTDKIGAIFPGLLSTIMPNVKTSVSDQKPPGFLSNQQSSTIEPPASRGLSLTGSEPSYSFTPGSILTAAEGSATPVQDEEPDDGGVTIRDNSANASSISNPMQFLTNFISQSGSGGVSNTFLSNLSEFTKKIRDQKKSDNQTDSVQEESSASPVSWNDWKSQQQKNSPSPVKKSEPNSWDSWKKGPNSDIAASPDSSSVSANHSSTQAAAPLPAIHDASSNRQTAPLGPPPPMPIIASTSPLLPPPSPIFQAPSAAPVPPTNLSWNQPPPPPPLPIPDSYTSQASLDVASHPASGFAQYTTVGDSLSNTPSSVSSTYTGHQAKQKPELEIRDEFVSEPNTPAPPLPPTAVHPKAIMSADAQTSGQSISVLSSTPAKKSNSNQDYELYSDIPSSLNDYSDNMSSMYPEPPLAGEYEFGGGNKFHPPPPPPPVMEQTPALQPPPPVPQHSEFDNPNYQGSNIGKIPTYETTDFRGGYTSQRFPQESFPRDYSFDNRQQHVPQGYSPRHGFRGGRGRGPRFFDRPYY